MTDARQAVVLLSGGLDSAVVLAICRAEGFAPSALTLDYGQRHRLELKAARAVERVFASSGRKLPMNVDGAIAAVLADMGFEPASMNGLFMIARVPGLIAHAL